MNRCRRFQEDMELWLDGDLDDEASRVLEAHLLRCPSCRDWLAMRQELGGRIRVLGRSALEAVEGAGQHPLGLLPMRGPGWAAFWLLGILALGGDLVRDGARTPGKADGVAGGNHGGG